MHRNIQTQGHGDTHTDGRARAQSARSAQPPACLLPIPRDPETCSAARARPGSEKPSPVAKRTLPVAAFSLASPEGGSADAAGGGPRDPGRASRLRSLPRRARGALPQACLRPATATKHQRTLTVTRAFKKGGWDTPRCSHCPAPRMKGCAQAWPVFLILKGGCP